jgi:hypothetical protein
MIEQNVRHYYENRLFLIHVDRRKKSVFFDT